MAINNWRGKMRRLIYPWIFPGGLVLGCSAMVAAAIPAKPFVLRINLPPARAIGPSKNRVAMVVAPDKQPVVMPPGARALRTAPTPIVVTGIKAVDWSAPVAFERLPKIVAAARLAIGDNIARAWDGYGLRGYVVAGPARLVDHFVCRRMAFWVDDARGGGQAIGSDWCLGSDGLWSKADLAIGPAAVRDLEEVEIDSRAGSPSDTADNLRGAS